MPINQNIISIHLTNKETVEALSGFELVFENNKLSKAFYLNDGEKQEHNLKSEEIGLEFDDSQDNVKLHLVENKNGPHQLGGEIPQEFQLP